MVLLAGGMTPRRLGRLVQRLLEIETYRMAACWAAGRARGSSRAGLAERELAELAQAIRTATPRRRAPAAGPADQAGRRGGEPACRHAFALFGQRGLFRAGGQAHPDIAESRLAGMQTIREFMDRRLTPARSTCEWAARRQDALSQRVSRISNLLRTRVEIEQQQSSQALLDHEPAPGHAAQAAVHGGGPVGGGHHLLHRRAGQLPGQGGPGTGLAAEPRDQCCRGGALVALLVWWLLRRGLASATPWRSASNSSS
jgi:hypothetical protein